MLLISHGPLLVGACFERPRLCALVCVCVLCVLFVLSVFCVSFVFSFFLARAVHLFDNAAASGSRDQLELGYSQSVVR